MTLKQHCSSISEPCRLPSETLQNIDRPYIVEKISQQDLLLNLYSDQAIGRHLPVIHRTPSSDVSLTKSAPSGCLRRATSRRARVSLSIGTVRTGLGIRVREGKRHRRRFPHRPCSVRMVACCHPPRIRHFVYLRAPGEYQPRVNEFIRERSYLV